MARIVSDRYLAHTASVVDPSAWHNLQGGLREPQADACRWPLCILPPARELRGEPYAASRHLKFSRPWQIAAEALDHLAAEIAQASLTSW